MTKYADVDLSGLRRNAASK